MKRPNNDVIIEALKKTSGNISRAATGLGYSRSALHKWINAEVELQEALKDIWEANCDEMEDVLRSLARGIPIIEDVPIDDGAGNVRVERRVTGWVEKPDRLAAFGILNAHAKDRGYNYRVTISDDKEFKVVVSRKIITRANVGEVRPEGDPGEGNPA